MAEKIGIAKVIKGTINASGSAGSRALEQGGDVFKGDTLVSAKSSSGSIQFLDKTVLNIGEGSKVSLDQYVYEPGKASGQVLFKLAQGTFRAVTGEIVKQNPENFKLQSPLATIGIRGTETAHTIPAPGSGNEQHLIMVFDGKPVVVQPLGGGAFQVLGQSGLKVEVGALGAGPVLVMTPQEYKYFQSLTAAALSTLGTPTDTLSTIVQQQSQSTDPRVQAAQDAAVKAAADAAAKAAAAEAAAKAAAEAAKGGDAAAKAAADAAAKSAADAAAKSAAEAKAAADAAGKAALENMAAQKALLLAEAARLAGQKFMAEQQGKEFKLTKTDDPNQLFLSQRGGPGEGQQPGEGPPPVYLSPLAAELLGVPMPPPPPVVPAPVTTVISDTLDLSTGPADLSGWFADLDPGHGGTPPAAPRDVRNYESNTERGVGLASTVKSIASNVVNITGGAYADKLAGNDVANILIGNAGNDELFGYGGNDTLDGGLGNDTLNGGGDTDTATYASALSAVNVDLTAGTATGGAGSDTLALIENIVGSAFNDTLGGDANPNDIKGGLGNDTIEGKDGNDTLDGGGGVDYVSYANAGAAVTVNLSTGTATGGAGTDTLSNFENINGSNSADTLTGDSGNNEINGNGGDDTISGGAGNDTINGGLGDDSIEGGAGDDTMDGGPGTSDTVTYANATAAVTVNLGTTAAQNTVGAGTDTISNFETLHGSAYADTLTDSTGNDTINGAAGNDTITSVGGQDTINCGLGDDTVNMGTNLTTADTLTGFDGVDTLKFTDADGADTDLDNVAGFEHITLGAAATVVTLHTPTAGVTFSIGSAVASWNPMGYVLNVDGTATTSLNFDASAITNGYLYIKGGAGNDTIKGINQYSTGTEITNKIYGGAGADTLSGAPTAAYRDMFIYKLSTEGGDTINGFATGKDYMAFVKDLDGGNFGFNSTAAAQARFFTTPGAVTGTTACWFVDGTDLKYDADGTGGGAAVTIATGAGLATMASTDLLVVNSNGVQV